MKRLLVPGLPFTISLVLSVLSMGRHIYWQDSGFYLTAVKEMGVLYPHGFVVYQLLCKAWTTVFSFIDFALAVHLFSAFCAAAAASVLALAARDFLRGESRDLAAALAGTLAAAGYTFWFSAIYAKVYALFYLALALLFWAVLRTASTPTKRGTATVAALTGLAWTVHPSVALGGLALGAYFVRASKTLGLKATALCLLPGPAMMLIPAIALPLLAGRNVEHSLGHPDGAGAVFSYLLGSRFTGVPGVFGLEASRVAGLATFLWEEYLGVGLALAGFGAWILIRRKRERALYAALWMLPYLLVTLLFKIEGQSDHWYVAACLPLVLAVAAGIEALGTIGPEPRMLQAAVTVAAVAWSALVNGRDLKLRDENLAETFGFLYLHPCEKSAVLFAQSDDIVATTWALQSVQGVRSDVIVVNSGQLGAEGIWYDRLLQLRHPELKLPLKFPETARRDTDVFVAAYLAANAGGSRPLYVTSPPSQDLLPKGFILVPQGVVWRLVPTDGDRVEPSHWAFPKEPEEIPPLFRRARGLAVTAVPDGFECRYEPYEKRLQMALIKARVSLADWQFRHGQYATAVRLYESVLPLDDRVRRSETLLQFLALGYVALNQPEKAEAAFKDTLSVATRPWIAASSWLSLGDLARGRGDAARALECWQAAGRIQGLTPEQQSAVRERLGNR